MLSSKCGFVHSLESSEKRKIMIPLYKQSIIQNLIFSEIISKLNWPEQKNEVYLLAFLINLFLSNK